MAAGRARARSKQIGDRVSSIVWLDAFKPENGQKGVDFASGFSRKAMEEAVAKGTPGRKGPPSKAFGVNEKDQAWVDSLLTDQPNGVATQPIRLTGAREKIAQEGLHPRDELSADSLRQGAGGVQG